MPEHVRTRASQTLDRSFVLTAGAGSGKTRVLVDRVVHCLAAGTPPAAVAAITFTEKAARELQERTRDELEARLAAASGPQATALQAALDHFSELTVSTIHGFCRQLLASEALEARWAPGSVVGSGAMAVDAVGLAYGRWRRGFDRRHPELAGPLRRLVGVKQLPDAARAVLDNRDLGLVLGAASVDWDDAELGLRAIARRVGVAVEGCQNRPECKGYNGNRAVLSRLADALSRATPEERVRHVLEGDAGPDKRLGKKGDWRGDTLKDFRDALGDLGAWIATWQTRALEPMHRALFEDLHEHYLGAVRELKAAHGQFDFADLLFRAADLLRGAPRVRARLARRYRAVLVDELQDTDPVQAEVVALLAREPDLDGPWPDHPPRPGHLFVVGDPRQSIYRFRRADLAVWEQLRSLVGRAGEGESLERNFRSVPAIVAFVNQAFAGLPGYHPQIAHRPPAALDPIIVLPSAHFAGAQIDAALRHLCDLRASGAQVVDRDTGQRRALQWRDVMIVLPSWSHAEATQDGFAQVGIPCAVEGGATFFERDEVRLSLAAMAAIEEPADSESIVVVLRGLFGCSHEQLARHCAEHGSWRYTLPDQPPGPVSDALGQLRELHFRRASQGWTRTLDTVLEATRAPAVWSLLPRGPQVLANLDKLREMIRQIEVVTPSSAEVCRKLARLANSLAGDTETDLPLADTEHDAVRITSLFKAKGLEAPIVVLVHANRGTRSPTSVIDREANQIAVRCGPLLPPGWAVREQAEEAEQLAERRRWMYVAATRARDQLVIVDTEKSNLIDLDLRAALSDQLTIRIPAELPAVARLSDTFRHPLLTARADELLAAPTTEASATDPVQTAWLAARDEALAVAVEACAPWRSVSQIVRTSRSGRANAHGTRQGKLVHQVMEQLDLSQGKDTLARQARATVRALASVEGLGPTDAARVDDIVGRLLAHPVLERARRAPEHWQEVPFTHEHRGRIIGGVIDLCFPSDATRTRWVVVDWKSDLPAPGDPDRATYERQLDHYARALIATLSPSAKIEHVEHILVGPHPELQDDPMQMALELVNPSWTETLEALVHGGATVPVIGLDVGKPVYCQLELAWPDQRVGVLLHRDAAIERRLSAEGWRIATEVGDLDELLRPAQ